MIVHAWFDSKIIVAVAHGEEDSFSFYLYRGDAVIEKTAYSSSQAHSFKISAPGDYRVKVFSLSAGGKKHRTWSEEILIENRDGELVSDTGPQHEPHSSSTFHSTKEDISVLTFPGEDRRNALSELFTLDSGEQESLGQLLHFALHGYDAARWVQDLRKGPAPSATGWFNSGKIKGTAEDILNDGWSFPKQSAILFDEPIDWLTPGNTNRTWGFELHAWRFLDPVLDEFIKTKDEKLLHWMLQVVQSWWSFAQHDPDNGSMAWYDMAISLRMPRLARLTIATAKSRFQNKAVALLFPILKHIEIAQNPSVFHPQNNHGFYSAAAALDFAKWLPTITGSDELNRIGIERMNIMAERQFASDGGHLEHSPDYHRMLLGSFEWAIRDDIVNDENVTTRIEKAVEVLGWMVQPDGHLVQFGDSPSFKLGGPGRNSSNSRTEYILTDGRRGVPNPDEMLVLPESGYAFVRSPQPTQRNSILDSSYLAFQAGFHSRAHKHADDLTFTWFDQGNEIIVDSGRYGYGELLAPDSPDRLKGFFYASAERQYVESTQAHNTVQVNGRDIERRERQPYGSAVGRCTKVDGRFILRGQVDHGHYLHERMLRLLPSQTLEVIDTLTPSGSPVEAISWFNLNGAFELNVENGEIFAEVPGAPSVLRISGEGTLVSPVRGQKSPLRGWRSRHDHELESVWNFGFKVLVKKRARFTTLFKFFPTS